MMPGFSLGALEVREQDDLLDHIRSCPACYQLAQEVMDTGAQLSRGIDEVVPSEGLRARVRASVAEIFDRSGPPGVPGETETQSGVGTQVRKLRQLAVRFVTRKEKE